ncbi:MAG: hypothetical protein L0H94_12375, partial [Nitrospira sp.]|nr:hypothetical protein [Nitrospira sp.]
MRTDKKPSQKTDKKTSPRAHSRGVVGYSKKSVLLEEAITNMNAGKYGRSSAALKELLALDAQNTEARRLFGTLHLRLGSLVTARQAFEALVNEAIERQDLWLAESLLREYLVAGPRCVPFLERLAYVYDEKGDAIAAVAELGKAIDVLIEDPDSDNPRKPSQLYAKVRELAPASPAALQFASLFDIQTGELLVSSPSSPAEVATLEANVSSHSQSECLVTTEVSRVFSEEMPWEQFEGAPPNHEAPPHTSPNPTIDALDVSEKLITPAPVDCAEQDPLSESTERNDETDRFDQEIATSISAVPLSSLNGYRADETGDPIVERSPFVEEEIPSPASEDHVGDVGSVIVFPVGSPGLSSPMPWEQIENATIKIEDPPPLSQSEGASVLSDESVFTPSAITQPERVSEQLSSPTPVQDMTEARESIFAAEPSPIPTILQEPEVSPSPAADSLSTTPFSWNTIFDGAWKFAEEPLSPCSPAALSTPDAMSRDT